MTRAATVVPATLTALAGLHGAWALGWRWPGGSDRALAERVVGSTEFPPAPMTWAVAGALTTAAVLVAKAGTGDERPLVRACAHSVAGVFLARAAGGWATDAAGGLGTTFQRLDAAIYSPLCLALGLGTLRAVRRG